MQNEKVISQKIISILMNLYGTKSHFKLSRVQLSFFSNSRHQLFYILPPALLHPHLNPDKLSSIRLTTPHLSFPSTLPLKYPWSSHHPTIHLGVFNLVQFSYDMILWVLLTELIPALQPFFPILMAKFQILIILYGFEKIN